MKHRIPAMESAWLVAMLLGVAAIYLPGLDNLPVFDDAYLVGGVLSRDFATPSELRARWLSYGSFVWIEAIFGEGLWKQRLFNVLLHVANVVMVWALHREIVRAIQPTDPAQQGVAHRSAAVPFAVGFFALNPVAIYAVAYLIQRSILMATLFTVIAFWALARAVRTRQKSLWAVALVSYALAVSSKEHAIFAPLAAMPLYIVVARPSRGRLAIVASVGALIAGIAAALLWKRYGEIIGTPFDEFSRAYLLQLGALDAQAPARALPLSIENQMWLFFQYGLRWIFPAAAWMSINLRPPFPLSLASFPHVVGVLAYLLVVGGGVFAILRYRDWRAMLGLSVLMPALLFLTEFLTVWVQDPFVLYRSYLWAIGVPGLVYCLVQDAPAKALAGVGAALALVFAWQGLDRVLSISTPERAWTDAIAKLPDDPRAVGRWFPYLNRGADYLERDDYALAMRDFERSTALGDMGLGAFNSGMALAIQGKHPQAVAFYDKAIAQGYDSYNVRLQWGISLLALGKVAEGHVQLEAARAMNPPSPAREVMLLNLGRAQLQLGKVEEAYRDLQALLAAKPGEVEGRYLMGLTQLSRKQPQEAYGLFDALIAQAPSGPAYYGRALAAQALSRKAQALEDIEKAIRADPRNPTLQDVRAKIRAMPGT